MITYHSFEFGERLVKRFKFDGHNLAVTEASGSIVKAYREAVISTANVGDDGKPRPGAGWAATDALLLAGCLWLDGADGILRPVSADLIASLPHRVADRLTSWVKEVSEIVAADTPDDIRAEIESLEAKLAEREKANGESPAKNAPSPSTAGSA